jgi:uncharacterized protein
MMQVTLHGGFGEKGRTSLCVSSENHRLLLDCGINTSDRANYYPAITAEELGALDAIFITHSHEDHIGGLGWCIVNGFRGDVFMTSETRSEADAIWADYATEAEHAVAAQQAITFVSVGQPIKHGPFDIITGRSGHIAGGYWCRISDGNKSVLYCGDVVLHSPVFPMDALPLCNMLVLDTSYGDDAVSGVESAKTIRAFVDKNPGSIMPTPLMGRSLELFALLEQPPALALGMRDALLTQLSQTRWIEAQMQVSLLRKLANAKDWLVGDAWPLQPILCHDGMGMGGPAKEIIARAATESQPILFTGHLPTGSLGQQILQARKAFWTRFPTHPSLSENNSLVAQCKPSKVLAHSCNADVVSRMKPRMPLLLEKAKLHDVINV